MLIRHPLTVSLAPELAELVASGLCNGASEVIRGGLRLLAKQGGRILTDRRSSVAAPQHVGLRAVWKTTSRD